VCEINVYCVGRNDGMEARWKNCWRGKDKEMTNDDGDVVRRKAV